MSRAHQGRGLNFSTNTRLRFGYTLLIMAVSPTLEEKLKSLPTSPGCYLYKDDKGEIIYVGKAVNLRNRVRSYFQKSANHSAKTR